MIVLHRPVSEGMKSRDGRIYLRRKPKDADRSAIVSTSFTCESVAKQSFDSERAAFDPEFCGFIDGLEARETAVCTRDERRWIFRIIARPCVWLQLAVKEGIEVAYDELGQPANVDMQSMTRTKRVQRICYLIRLE